MALNPNDSAGTGRDVGNSSSPPKMFQLFSCSLQLERRFWGCAPASCTQRLPLPLRIAAGCAPGAHRGRLHCDLTLRSQPLPHDWLCTFLALLFKNHYHGAESPCDSGATWSGNAHSAHRHPAPGRPATAQMKRKRSSKDACALFKPAFVF